MFQQPVFLGEVALAQGPAPSGPPTSPPQGGAPTASVPHIVHNGGSPQDLQFRFWRPDWPQFYPVFTPPVNQRMVCRKLEEETEEEGRDVFECKYEPPTGRQLVTYPARQLFWFF